MAGLEEVSGDGVQVETIAKFVHRHVMLALVSLPQPNEDVASHPDDRRHRQTRWTGDLQQQQLVVLIVHRTPSSSSFIHPQFNATVFAKAQH